MALKSKDASWFPELIRDVFLSNSDYFQFWQPDGMSESDLFEMGVVCLKLRSSIDFPEGIHLITTVPRVSGGSFTLENLRYLRSFLKWSESQPQPVIFILNTGGVRISQPREIFQDVFGTVPDLFRIRAKKMLITVAIGKSLGIGALFFGQGSLRLSAGKSTLINLTGPKVIKDYFGQEKDEFKDYASSGHQFESNFLIHEQWDNDLSALRRVLDILRFVQAKTPLYDHLPSRVGVAPIPIDFQGEVPDLPPASKTPELVKFLTKITDFCVELMPDRTPKWRTFLCLSDKKLFGLLVQPPGSAENTIGVPEVMRALEAVRCFKALGIPLVSAINSPGGDPRRAASDQDIVLRSLELAEALSSYPMRKAGVILERCYGGIGLFTLPRDHGSEGLFSLPEGRIGIMSDSIISSIITPESKLHEEWSKTQKKHRSGMSDMVETNNIQKSVPLAELRATLHQALWG